MYLHARDETHTHAHICTHTCTHSRTLKHTHTYTYTHTHSSTHTHTHTHTHIHTQTSVSTCVITSTETSTGWSTCTVVTATATETVTLHPLLCGDTYCPDNAQCVTCGGKQFCKCNPGYYGDDCADYHADCEACQDCGCNVGLFGIFVKCGDPLCAPTSETLPGSKRGEMLWWCWEKGKCCFGKRKTG